MNQAPSISDSEWIIMKILWNNAPLSANEVIDALKSSTDWKPKTVKTLLGRLVQKGALGYNTSNRSYLYYPLISEQESVKSESLSFFKKVTGNSLKTMLVSFLEEQKLTKDDIDELKRILDDKEK